MELSQQEWGYSEITGNGHIHTILNWAWWWYTNTCIQILGSLQRKLFLIFGGWSSLDITFCRLLRMSCPLHDWWKKLVRPPPSRRKRWGTRNDGENHTDHQWDLDGSVGVSRNRHFLEETSPNGSEQCFAFISDWTLFSSPSSINVECWEDIIDNVPLYDVEWWEHINVGFWINCKLSRDPPTRVAMDVWISLKFSMSLFDDQKRLPPNGLDGRQKAYEHMVVS